MPEANTLRAYKRSMHRYFSFNDGIYYPASFVASQEKLLEVTSDDICRFFKQEAYHNEDPTEDMRPTFCRISNLEVHKRAISHFMSSKLIPWDPISLIGNPTKSKEVNELINDINKFECRREGVPSQAQRPIEFDEFKNLLDVTRDPSADSDDLRLCRMARTDAVVALNRSDWRYDEAKN
jgi:hypothetical protein